MKVRCIESRGRDDEFTAGKMYNYSHDSLLDNAGHNWRPGYDIDTWNSNQWDNAGCKIAKFEEIKEENMTYQYQTGDVVRVREDLRVGRRYGRINMLADGMDSMRGRNIVVQSVNDHGSCLSGYFWSPEMLEPISITFDWPQFKQARFAVKCASEQESERFVRFIYDECGYTNPHGYGVCKQDTQWGDGDECYYMCKPDGLWIQTRHYRGPILVIPFSAFKNFKEETTKIVCVASDCRYFTIGKTYDISNGYLVDDHSGSRRFNLDEWNRTQWDRTDTKVAKFEYIKESGETTMYNLEQAEAKLREAEAEQESATRKVTEARRMIEEAQRDAAKPKWPGLRKGDKYWTMDHDSDGYCTDWHLWDDDKFDNDCLKNGQIFTTESECQHFCDMLNYQLLVRGKALQMGGLLGYGKDVEGERPPHVLYRGNCGFGGTRIHDWPSHQPCVPLITEKCAAALKSDLDVIEAGRKAWSK